MSPTPSLRQSALGDLEHELATTRRVLERVPEEHFGWKPHEKSYSLGDLATHLANLVYWQTTMLRQDHFDVASTPQRRERAASREALLEEFDRHVQALRDALAGLDDAALAAPWSLRRGEQVLLQGPRVGMVRSMGISHMVHHRGQLSVYLRLLGVPVPPIYGPTADEAPF